MDDGLLTRPVFMLIVIAATVLIIKAVIDYLSRRQLIAKGTIPEELNSGGAKATKWHLIKNLKWALICLGFGAAVIIHDSFPDWLSKTGAFGLMFLGAGLGYLVYFFVAWRWFAKEKQGKE